MLARAISLIFRAVAWWRWGTLLAWLDAARSRGGRSIELLPVVG
jgi:hypothetical protein